MTSSREINTFYLNEPAVIFEEVIYDKEQQTISVQNGDWKHGIPLSEIITAAPLAQDDTTTSEKGYAIAYVKSQEAKEGEELKPEDAVPGFHYMLSRELPNELKDIIIPKADSISDSKSQIPHLRVIISTLSGTCQSERFFNQTVHPLLKHMGYTPETLTIHTTTSADSITDLTNTTILPLATAGKPQHILLLSGDGGTIDILNALALSPSTKSPTYTAPHLSVLPLGTGNALAHSLGLTNNSTWGLSSLFLGTPSPLPYFRTTFSPCARLLVDEATRTEPLPTVDGKPTLYGAVVCSWAMHASLVADSDTREYRKHGAERFKMAAKEALYPSSGGPPHAYKAAVSILPRGKSEWVPLERDEHMYVLATMVSNLEKKFTISPASKPLSGELRVVHFGPTTADEAMRVMGLAYQGGKHVEEESVGYEDVDGLRIEFRGREEDERWRRICVDGKIVRLGDDGWVEMRKEESRVLDVVV